MKKPIILCIDDDPQVLTSVETDLRNRYRREYRILRADSGKQALDTIKTLALKNEPVALLLADQIMPSMSGVEFLEKAKDVYPAARRVLLTAYADTRAAISAINDAHLHHYLLKPWDPPEANLYPVLDDLLTDWHAEYRHPFVGLRVIGYQWSPKSHQLKDFLVGNLVPYRWIDMETDPGAPRLLETAGLTGNDLPAALFEDGTVLKQPGLQELAVKTGMQMEASREFYDVIIVGAGPSGLSAAVYGASEGLKTLLIDRRAPGGQAGTSSRIENYLGFPAGLSGADLTRRALTQATRFGAEFLTPQEVRGIRWVDAYKIVTLEGGKELQARSVIIATGVSYRRLEAPGEERFSGAGIYYGSASTEVQACRGKPVFIAGGGNSAGQAAMFLSKYACDVDMLIRGASLAASMSQYLVDQISQTPNIHVRPHTLVEEAKGGDRLETLVLKDAASGEKREAKTQSLFVFIGAKPCTDWLPPEILKGEGGYVLTGRDLVKEEGFRKTWKMEREPYLLESSVPGVFAAGDVRHGAMARVASAVGEGSMAIKFVHEYLAQS